MPGPFLLRGAGKAGAGKLVQQLTKRLGFGGRLLLGLAADRNRPFAAA